jgi:NAD(P)H-quinone oxidoreductase subunit 6
VADGATRPERRILEPLGFGALILGAVALIFWVFATQIVKGVAPVAAEGANIAKPSDLLFYVFAAGAIASAAGVAFSRNILYSALSLLGALLAAGALYVFLGAEYVAVTQLLIYIGGVLVLVLFAVMLTHRMDDKSHTNPSVGVLPGLGLLVALVVLLGFVATKTPWKTSQGVFPESTAAAIGNLFLDHYLLPFEISSLVLLATLIGAVVVARKEIKE